MKINQPGCTPRLPAVLAALLLFCLAGNSIAAAFSLGPGDDQLVSGEYYDRITFTGVAGDAVSIEVSSRDFSPYLIILDGADSPMLEDYADSLLQLTYTLPASGSYTLLITTVAPGETGSYRLSLWAAAEGAASAPAPTGGAQTAPPNTVMGTVIDAQGRPLPGARVSLYPALTTGQVNATTDAAGNYIFQSLPDVPYDIRAYTSVNYGGQQICMRLAMENEADYNSFTAGSGITRNFQLRFSGQIRDIHGNTPQHFGGAIYFVDGPAETENGAQVEFSFTPAGPLVDGSQSSPFTRTYTSSMGNLIHDIPVGPYRLSAVLIQPDGARQPLLLRHDAFAQATPFLDIDWSGDGGCTLGSGFDRVTVHTDYWDR